MAAQRILSLIEQKKISLQKAINWQKILFSSPSLSWFTSQSVTFFQLSQILSINLTRSIFQHNLNFTLDVVSNMASLPNILIHKSKTFFTVLIGKRIFVLDWSNIFPNEHLIFAYFLTLFMCSIHISFLNLKCWRKVGKRRLRIKTCLGSKVKMKNIERYFLDS